MTTAREQVREAAVEPIMGLGQTEYEWHRTMGADAASDVWEPEVERWKAHTLALSKVIDAMLATGAYTSAHKQIHDEAKEALES